MVKTVRQIMIDIETDRLRAENAELRRRLEVIRDTLMIYANKENWYRDEITYHLHDSTELRWFAYSSQGWEPAQQTLDQIREK